MNIGAPHNAIAQTVSSPVSPPEDASLAKARARNYASLKKSFKNALRSFDRRNKAMLLSAQRNHKVFCTGTILDLNQDGRINIQDKAFSIALIDTCTKLGADFSQNPGCLVFDLNGDGIVDSADSAIAWDRGDNYAAEYCSSGPTISQQ